MQSLVGEWCIPNISQRFSPSHLLLASEVNLQIYYCKHRVYPMWVNTELISVQLLFFKVNHFQPYGCGMWYQGTLWRGVWPKVSSPAHRAWPCPTKPSQPRQCPGLPGPCRPAVVLGAGGQLRAPAGSSPRTSSLAVTLSFTHKCFLVQPLMTFQQEVK